MKSKFNAFYYPSDQEISSAWQDENTVFIFDTSALLNLYTLSENGRNDFFKIAEKIKDKVWIPFHIGLEYQLNRVRIIREAKGIFKNINDKLNGIDNIFKGLDLSLRFPALEEEKKLLESRIKKSIAEYREKVHEFDKKQMEVRSPDTIRYDTIRYDTIRYDTRKAR